jgi:hypothetical protein
MARRGWATGVVVIVALAAGVGGIAYFWKELATDSVDSDGGVDAGPDGKAARGKPKTAKKGGGSRPRGSKPRTGPKPSGGGGGGGGGSNANPNPNSLNNNNGDDTPNDDDDSADDFVPPFRGRGPAGPTYESALASNRQEINIGGKQTPDLTDAQIGGPMRGGGFVGECGAPDAMKVTVKVAIKQGRAAGVSVSTSPNDPDIAGCIDRYVRTFTWPSSNKMDFSTTTY